MERWIFVLQQNIKQYHCFVFEKVIAAVGGMVLYIRCNIFNIQNSFILLTHNVISYKGLWAVGCMGLP